jgi:hypothetical protein
MEPTQMKITLKRKSDVSDRDPLLVQYLEGPEGRQTKKTISVKIGETLDIEDDLAIEIMQKYRGMFAMGEGEDSRVSQKTAQLAHKGKPSYADKALEAKG